MGEPIDHQLDLGQFSRVDGVRSKRCFCLGRADRGRGHSSSANGGELLFLALATCYCNDIYREAERQGTHVVSVEVEVDGDFGGVGEPAQNVSYRARVTVQASREAIQALMKHTDQVAEIQNTLRVGTPVILKEIEAIQAS